MTTRRATLRSSVFLVLALAAAHVPACEYGQGTQDPNDTGSSSVARVQAQDAAPAVVLELPLLPRA